MYKKPSFNDGKGQYFMSVEELYKKRLNALLLFASKHCANKDDAIDIVHSALAKSIEYTNKHKDKHVSERVVQYLIIKACRKLNKFTREVPMGDTRDLVP